MKFPCKNNFSVRSQNISFFYSSQDVQEECTSSLESHATSFTNFGFLLIEIRPQNNYFFNFSPYKLQKICF